MISQTLPDVKGYFVQNKNPILECLVDQMDHDEQRSGGKLTGLALRDEIIHALTQNTIEWPQQSNKIITKEEWIRLMKKHPFFYFHQSRNDSIEIRVGNGTDYKENPLCNWLTSPSNTFVIIECSRDYS